MAGELDEKSRREVEHVLRNDAALRESFVTQMQMDSVLRELLGPGAEERQAEFDRGVIARLRSEGAGDQRVFTKSVLLEIVEERGGLQPVRWADLIKTGVISAAASIALLLLLQGIVFREAPDRAEVKKEVSSIIGFAARIERAVNPVWSVAGPGPIHQDGWLRTGLLRLESGSVYLSFNSGATAIIEGPAELSIESGNRVFLKSGRITAEVPPAASGFTVNTPRFNAVDIGTRFGIIVDGEGNSELHVMQGEVEVSRASGNSVPIRVYEGLAIRADSRTRTELRPVSYEGDHFKLQLGKPRVSQPDLCFHFDESVGAILEDSGRNKLFDVPMIGSGELDHSPRRGPGRKGGGLVFQAGETLDVALSSDFQLDEPHTISFWLKIPPKVGRNIHEEIMHYGGSSRFWRVSANFGANRGERGAFRLDCGDSYVVGSSDIADGNWHHVAYRYIATSKSDLASQIHLFVDGKPEVLSDFQSGSVLTGPVGSLKLGGTQSQGFQGWIDDLNVFREAASTATIQTLAE